VLITSCTHPGYSVYFELVVLAVPIVAAVVVPSEVAVTAELDTE
jgi:hypothetical protein